jgi:2-dehydro-3-deoxyphosphogluconate aldolase / (4S)-4-hydroxy-2-oxoglutarate aldolase
MAKFSRIEVVLKMKETGVIPVFYHPDTEVCKQVVKACYDAGIRVFEFTNRGDFATLTFAELNKWTIKNYSDMIMGVGSVLDAPTAAMYIALGANFIVSPILSEEMAKTCNKRKIAWSPGCGSLTEISKAEELGAEVVKIFPGSSVGGPEFVKNVKGPCPWTSIMPTGGVEPTKENLKKWFDAGVHCVGMGSKLFPKEAIEQKKWEEITRLAKEAMDIAKAVRQK